MRDFTSVPPIDFERTTARAKSLKVSVSKREGLALKDLSQDQRAAHDAIMTWLNRGTAAKRVLTLAGFAGTGKSSVVSVLAHELLKLGPIAFCAFTGKASSVLGRKLAAAGIATMARTARRDPLTGMVPFEPRPYCGTIHGLVYRPCDSCMVERTGKHTYGPLCREESDEVAVGVDASNDGTCPACDPPPPVKRDGPCPQCHGARYFRREVLDRAYKLIVLDEASMVADGTLEDLTSYGVPILAVGDHGQLPPVRGTGSLMKAPDLRLEKIHRQAEGNPIIALSARIRATGDIDDSLEDEKAFTILPRRELQGWIGRRFNGPARLNVDPKSPEGVLGTVLISWTNKLRVSLNYDVREALDHDGPPSKGEAVICLKNKAPIYNGMRGVLTTTAERWGDTNAKAPKWRCSVDFVEDDQKAENILCSEHQFFAEKTIDYDAAQAMGVSMSSLGELYDFGYALTCHKMQGSQAPEVCVVLEPGLYRMGRDERTAWVYTAVTRAAERLTVVR